jgi:hypothetical protein
MDLPVQLADENSLALVDGNLWWTNLNLERHDVCLWFACKASTRSKICWLP